jgi:hypothetical protein
VALYLIIDRRPLFFNENEIIIIMIFTERV